MVLCAHQYALLFQPEPKPFGLVTLGTFGVLIFFTTSGYLVAQSWERDPNGWRFAVRRFLRIWPALAVVTLMTVFCLGPAFTDLGVSDYFRSTATWTYLKYIYLSTNLYLPGVFESNPWHVVNGSLWTILIEVKWYGILLAAGLCGLLRPRLGYLALLIVALYAAYIYFVWDVQHNVQSAYPRPQFGCEYGTFFCYGAMLHFFRHAWVGRAVVVMAGLLLIAGVLVVLNYQYAALYTCLPFVLIWGGGKSSPLLRQAGRFGDFSYGIYLYAYPVQQGVISIMGIHHSYWVMLLISFVVTTIFAACSWHLVERPVLALKRYLRPEAKCDEAAMQTTKLGAIA